MQEYYNYHFIGKVISEYRYMHNVTLTSLAEGLCSTSFLSRIEAGIKTPDKLLTECLIQRLGHSSENICFYIGPKDFDNYLKRKSILDAYRSGDTSGMRILLEEYAKMYKHLSPAERQFLFISKYHQGDVPADEKLDCLRKAINATHPNFSLSKLDHYALSTNDAYIIMELVNHETDFSKKTIYINNLISKLSPEQGFFAQMMIVDIVLSLIYSCNSCELATIADNLLKTRKMMEAYDLAYRIDEISTALQSTYNIPIPEHIVERYAALYQEHPIRDYWNENCYVYPIGEVIRERRHFMGLSISKLCGDTCCNSTLHRIENGTVEPKHELRRYLFDRLGLSGEEYESQLISSSPEDFISEIQFTGTISETEDYICNHIKSGCNTRNVITNRQYLSYDQALSLANGSSEKLEALWSALHITLPLTEECESLPTTILTINEINILTELACQYILRHNITKAKKITNFIRDCLTRPHFMLSRSAIYMYGIYRVDQTYASVGIVDEVLHAKVINCLKIHYHKKLIDASADL